MHPLLRSFCEAEGIAIVDGQRPESPTICFQRILLDNANITEEEAFRFFRPQIERTHWFYEFEMMHTDSSLKVAPYGPGGREWTLSCWAKPRRGCHHEFIKFRAEAARLGVNVLSPTLTRDDFARTWAAVGRGTTA